MKRFGAAILTCALTLMPAGCGKAESAGGATPTTAKEGAPTATVAPLIAAYDVLREALASDDLAAAKAAAGKLAEVAKADQPKVAEAATAAAGAADIDTARIAFGNASKALLEAVQAKPALGEGLLVFRCPMTETYQKWVQLARPMRNPYMGSKMLECGSKADLTP